MIIPKKILVISSSPRRGGNSETLCEQFIKGAKSVGHKCEKIALAQLHMEFCTGCGLCTDPRKKCHIKDDIALIYRKLLNADVIVLATPVYLGSMCGQMKTFIDRLCAVYQHINYRQFYFIVSMGADSKKSADLVLKEFRAAMACFEGSEEVGVIVGKGVEEVGDIVGTREYREAFRIGKGVM
ncbi:MAG: flavodoxin family protein [Firmicutes bacterium]|nr:flavodoxin family protein [Bacillota bacterium]